MNLAEKVFILESGWYNRFMYIGVGLVLVALGAILSFGVSNAVEGFNLNTIGIVLMAVGALAVALSFVVPGRSPRAGAVREEDEVVSTRRRPL
jgi:hypothetical protein